MGERTTLGITKEEPGSLNDCMERSHRAIPALSASRLHAGEMDIHLFKPLLLHAVEPIS